MIWKVTQEHLHDFILNYNDFQSMMLPDFTGDCVNAYISIKDMAAWIKYLKRAFQKGEEPLKKLAFHNGEEPLKKRPF